MRYKANLHWTNEGRSYGIFCRFHGLGKESESFIIGFIIAEVSKLEEEEGNVSCETPVYFQTLPCAFLSNY